LIPHSPPGGEPLPHQVLGAPLELQPLPACPELRLHLVSASVDLEVPLAAAWQVEQIPFWVFCWAAGAALASHLLAHPEEVRGRRVVDFGAGSGVAGIAAARAGAARVVAVDEDPAALAAARANAAVNGVTLETASRVPDDGWDLLLAADVLYEGSTNLERLLGWTGPGRAILLAAPERPGVPPLPWTPFAWIATRTFPDVDAPAGRVRLFRL
jgi:predicted nicotinamide N-methyase